MLNVYKNQQNRQTGSRNLMGPKMLPMIWDTYMKLVTKYQISAINSYREKCDEKCAYMFNVYKNQLCRQTGSRNLMGPKTLPTIWGTYMTLVTRYQIYFTLNGGSNGASLSKKGKFIIGKERTSIKLISSGVAAIEATKAVASVKTSTTKIRRFIFLFFFNPAWSVLWKNQICIVI